MLPFYQLMVPNDSPQQFEYLQQPTGNPTKEDIKKWIMKNLADNSESLKTIEDYEAFLDEPEINKVLLISKRNKTPPNYRVVSSTYLNRVRVGFTTHDSPIAEKYKLENFPAIVINNNYDISKKVEKKEAEEVWYKSDDFKLPALKEFID